MKPLQHVAKDKLVMAATVLVVIPVLIVYFFFQCWIVQGFTISGFRG